MDFLSHCHVIDLIYCHVIDDNLSVLTNLTALRSLNLGACYITDAGLPALSNLIALQNLNLTECTHITDAGLPALSSLVSLCELNLNRCSKISGIGLSALNGLTHLQSLMLSECTSITNAGLQALSNLGALKELWLCESPINHASISILSNLKIDYLNLRRCHINNADMLVLRNLHTLQHLDLRDCNQIGMAGLRALSNLVNLQKLKFGGSREFVLDHFGNNQMRTLKMQFLNPGIRLIYEIDNFCIDTGYWD